MPTSGSHASHCVYVCIWKAVVRTVCQTIITGLCFQQKIVLHKLRFAVCVIVSCFYFCQILKFCWRSYWSYMTRCCIYLYCIRVQLLEYRSDMIWYMVILTWHHFKTSACTLLFTVFVPITIKCWITLVVLKS